MVKIKSTHPAVRNAAQILQKKISNLSTLGEMFEVEYKCTVHINHTFGGIDYIVFNSAPELTMFLLKYGSKQ